MSQEDNKEKPPTKAHEREERLKAALKVNLRRRKDQARGRKAAAQQNGQEK